MVMHGLACSKWIASADRFHNVGMLAGGKLAVVSDVDGSKHEALHLTAYLGDSTHQQAVTTQPCNADVEFCIGFDRAFVTVAVFAFILYPCEFRQALNQSGVSPTPRGYFRAKPFQFGPVLIHLVQLFWGTRRSRRSCCKRMIASRTGVRLPLYLIASTF